MKIDHFFTYVEHGQESREISIQISSVLIQINDRNFLIDTGFTGRKEIVYILNKLGLSTLDIHYVLNTHIHPDHCGGNRYFPNAEIYLSERDYFFQRDFMHAMREANVDHLEAIVKQFYPQFNQKQTTYFSRIARDMATIWEDDIVGNTEQIVFIEQNWPFDFIEAVETPGHSIQHYSFKINTPRKPFLVTGDALSTKMTFRVYKLDFPYCYDANEYIKSQKKIGAFHGIIIPGHDKPFDTESGEYVEKMDTDSGDDNEANGFLEQYLRE